MKFKMTRQIFQNEFFQLWRAVLTLILRTIFKPAIGLKIRHLSKKNIKELKNRSHC